MPLLHADRAEVSWDNDKSKWMVRIQMGEEVIRRYCKGSKDTDSQTLQADALQTAKDEGYDVDAANVTIKR